MENISTVSTCARPNLAPEDPNQFYEKKSDPSNHHLKMIELSLALTDIRQRALFMFHCIQQVMQVQSLDFKQLRSLIYLHSFIYLPQVSLFSYSIIFLS